MTRPMHAVISLAALDVRRRPDHRAELTSQLLLGEVVRVLGDRPDRQWWRVENLTDGYRGWVRGWGLVFTSGGRARFWQNSATARVAVPATEVRTGRGRGPLVSPLFLNSRVIALRRRGRHRQVQLPDGRRGWVRNGALATREAPPRLIARVRGLLGAPYHWGGRTPLGFDCSSFTQQVLAEQGISLPRDCFHQFRVSRTLGKSESPKEGDLVFFAAPGVRAGHVGVRLAGGYFAHCRGSVRISSLDRHNLLCDKELVHQFIGWRRPRTQVARSRRKGAPGGESA
jgi:cell wall-associated NlpC family hydrolase